MKKSCSNGSSKLDRKTVERNRRMHMKGLTFKLASLIPNYHSSSKDSLSQLDQLDHATFYIRKLQERIEELKRKKQLVMSSKEISNDHSIDSTTTTNSSLPALELRDLGSTLEVILISGLNKSFMFYEVISVLEEEGAQVVNASFSTVGDKVFHTIHSQVTSSRVGVETSRVCERLKELIY